MPGPVVRIIIGCGMPVIAVLLSGCTDLPTFIPKNQTIQSIRVSGCSAVGVTESCPMTARAWDAEGNEIQNPPLVWRSSRPGIASVTGAGSNATITGIVAGRTVISASDGAQRTSDSIAVTVAALKTPSEE